jgi:CHAD domain-containing protein
MNELKHDAEHANQLDRSNSNVMSEANHHQLLEEISKGLADVKAGRVHDARSGIQYFRIKRGAAHEQNH